MVKNRIIRNRAYNWNRNKHRKVDGEEIVGLTPYAYNLKKQKVDRRYRVTEDGRVISFIEKEPHFISQFPNYYDRMRVSLSGAKNIFVSKLIWFSFAANAIMNQTEMPDSQVEIKTMEELAVIARNENRIIHHEDSIKENNSISNLELEKRWVHLPYVHGLKYSDSMDADNEKNIADFEKLKNCDEGVIFIQSTNTKTGYKKRRALDLSVEGFAKANLIKRDILQLYYADWQSGGTVLAPEEKENIKIILPDGEEWYYTVFFGRDGALHADRIPEQPTETLAKIFVERKNKYEVISE